MSSKAQEILLTLHFRRNDKVIDMKDKLKNPITYYVAVSLIVVLWPLLLWGVYVPKANQKLQQKIQDTQDGRLLMLEILTLDPERKDYAEKTRSGDEFDYAIVIQSAAESCGIPSAKYKLSSRPAAKKGETKTQAANVTLDQLSVLKISQFISKIQFRWHNLKCTRLKLTKLKGLDDSWKADLEFVYYY